MNYNIFKPTQLGYTYNNRWGRQSNLTFNLGMKWNTPTIGIRWRF